MSPRNRQKLQFAWKAYEEEFEKYLNLADYDTPLIRFMHPDHPPLTTDEQKKLDQDILECKIKMERMLELIDEILDIGTRDEQLPDRQERREEPVNKVLLSQSKIFDELT